MGSEGREERGAGLCRPYFLFPSVLSKRIPGSVREGGQGGPVCSGQEVVARYEGRLRCITICCGYGRGVETRLVVVFELAVLGTGVGCCRSLGMHDVRRCLPRFGLFSESANSGRLTESLARRWTLRCICVASVHTNPAVRCANFVCYCIMRATLYNTLGCSSKCIAAHSPPIACVIKLLYMHNRRLPLSEINIPLVFIYLWHQLRVNPSIACWFQKPDVNVDDRGDK